MLHTPSLDAQHQSASSTDDSDATAHPVRVLLIPNGQRMLITLLLWSFILALYSRSMESLGVEASRRYGLSLYLGTNIIGGLIVLSVSIFGWYMVASRLWRRSEAARRRYAMEGMYALLPLEMAIPLMTALALIGGTLSFELWLTVLTRVHTEPALVLSQRDLLNSLIITLFHCVVLYSIDMLRVRATMQRMRAETAQRLNVEAQLQRLQAQMEPHMLFNTLANLHALIDANPGKAQDMLAHLIDYLRATLSASRAGSVSLRDEMARVQDYLALMQIRMGERLRVIMDVPAELRELKLPPMLIQPLVENAVKHGLDPLPEGGTLHVLARREHNMLEITVRDDGQGLEASRAKPSDSGFGLSCVQARLQASYGDDARLILEPGSQGSALPRPGSIAMLRLPVDMPRLPSTPTLSIR